MSGSESRDDHLAIQPWELSKKRRACVMEVRYFRLERKHEKLYRVKERDGEEETRVGRECRNDLLAIQPWAI